VRLFFTAAAGNFARDQNMSLWDAGNLMIKSARNILQNVQANYGFDTGRSASFVNDTDVLYIVSVDHTAGTHLRLLAQSLIQQPALEPFPSAAVQCASGDHVIV
jgi:hypothetical protein